MWRPRSDISRLQFRDAHLSVQREELQGVALYIRQPKEAQQKTSKLGLLHEDKAELCAVREFHLFMLRTQQKRQSLPEDHTLFLTYLDKSSEQGTPTSIRPSTLASWVKSHMVKAGVSESISPHSLRLAASTKAVLLGNSPNKVKTHAGWSLTSNSFKNCYRPTRHHHASTHIHNSIFLLRRTVLLCNPKRKQQVLY
ncbi:hypothetical protein PHYBLDRAFT_145564 [Phycomyces blakesleeanus NRRL 1555(-)]|uniref:Tyr recombinase domain-containing protein n=1 Tax=Phycomyces blakesleeanus (strain ATCC 8743b / DSM 1359 / FGSC 10004 / NBRC 33097 / NRRL 1555) TaxID=763407 RepID=A0A162NCU1_PHYB8|nr:hypothetical protein PHYBLDRAFT_145564 [Phycomyces blakesleeanus NRRL 1555(-)]OAD73158.1 hypothetical protein PHYBLDRAFT_145564 [Phycomyces blakesleeanus NRRL 1555(-)]|eukprot:XP_018291198.1 hypothetical protein PHYBLDRAFT_145564 [Phycomyces blakesleeanus NRRL 1555(-)]